MMTMMTTLYKIGRDERDPPRHDTTGDAGCPMGRMAQSDGPTT